MQLLTITEAATLANRSIQTMRRMIKQKKIAIKRQKTPQGFNYLIVKEALENFLQKSSRPDIHGMPDSQETSREHRPISDSSENKFQNEIERFNTTIQKLIEQNERDKANFFELIKTFQSRNFELENEVKLLKAPKKGFWKLW